MNTKRKTKRLDDVDGGDDRNDRDDRDVTRAEAGKTWGVSKSTVCRWERDGKITATVNASGAHVFRAADVRALMRDDQKKSIERLPRARTHVPSAANADGETCAQVFERLERSMHIIDIVIELRLPSVVVEGLAARWLRLDRGLILQARHGRTIEEAVGIARTRNADEFTEAICEKMKFWKDPCEGCNERTPAYCARCVRAREAKAAIAAIAAPREAPPPDGECRETG